MFLENNSCSFQSQDRFSPRLTVKVQCSAMSIFSSCFSTCLLLADTDNAGAETRHGRWMRVAKASPTSWYLQSGNNIQALHREIPNSALAPEVGAGAV